MLASTLASLLAMSAAALHATGWRDPVPAANYDAAGMLVAQSKRAVVAELIAATAHEHRPGLAHEGDVYNFGVYTGGGLRALVKGFGKVNVSFNHIWGFDSFTGLPTSNLRLHSPTIHSKHVWQEGDLNAADQMYKVLGSAAYDFEKLSAHIIRHIGTSRATLVRGFFNESLPALSPTMTARMRPALLVDVDCDIYEGTVEGLSWLLQHHLLVVGSFVYYDDWQRAGEGEVKAHDELTAQYRLVWRDMKLPEACRRAQVKNGCERQALFQLTSMRRSSLVRGSFDSGARLPALARLPKRMFG